MEPSYRRFPAAAVLVLSTALLGAAAWSSSSNDVSLASESSLFDRALLTKGGESPHHTDCDHHNSHSHGGDGHNAECESEITPTMSPNFNTGEDPTPEEPMIPPGSVCLNNHAGFVIDFACSVDLPVCATITGTDPPLGEGGDQCVRCLNTESGAGLDLCCDEDAPICVTFDGSEPDMGFDGEACISICRNTMTGGYTDEGCEEGTANMCLINDGKVMPPYAQGLGCYECINDDPNNGLDTGCSAETPACDADFFMGGECAVCVNDKEALVDAGCVYEFMFCNAPTGMAGTECMRCQPSEMAVDPGCHADTPVCRAIPGVDGLPDVPAACYAE